MKQGRTSTKVAISLPRTLYRALERVRRETGESRSALVQRLIRERLEEGERETRVRRYLEGYRRAPETAEEIEAAQAAATALLAEEPWT